MNDLWLARSEEHFDDSLYAGLLEKITAHGCDAKRLVKTLQPVSDSECRESG